MIIIILAMLDKMCDCAHYPGPAKVPQILGFIDAVRYFNSYSQNRVRRLIASNRFTNISSSNRNFLSQPLSSHRRIY